MLSLPRDDSPRRFLLHQQNEKLRAVLIDGGLGACRGMDRHNVLHGCPDDRLSACGKLATLRLSCHAVTHFRPLRRLHLRNHPPRKATTLHHPRKRHLCRCFAGRHHHYSPRTHLYHHRNEHRVQRKRHILRRISRLWHSLHHTYDEGEKVPVPPRHVRVLWNDDHLAFSAFDPGAHGPVFIHGRFVASARDCHDVRIALKPVRRNARHKRCQGNAGPGQVLLRQQEGLRVREPVHEGVR